MVVLSYQFSVLSLKTKNPLTTGDFLPLKFHVSIVGYQLLLRTED